MNESSVVLSTMFAGRAFHSGIVLEKYAYFATSQVELIVLYLYAWLVRVLEDGG